MDPLARLEQPMGPWRSQSDPPSQTALALGCAAVGLLLAVGFRHHGADTNALAGFLLGWLLLAIGVAGYVSVSQQTVVVDPAERRITISDSTRCGTRERFIAFADIRSVTVGSLGKRSNYVMSYYLELHLTHGGTYPLFAPGRFFEGTANRDTVEEWQRHLTAYLSQ